MAVYIIKDAEGKVINRIVASEEFVAERYEHYEEEIPPEEDPALQARMWRDGELARTDMLMLVPDYPSKETLLLYRQTLRDWPASESFPHTYPDVLV